MYTVADGIVAAGLKYAPTNKGVTSTIAPGVTEYPGGFDMDPGETIPFSGVFFVHKGDFDAVALYCSVAFTKFADVYPTQITYLPNKAFRFVNAAHKQGYALGK